MGRWRLRSNGEPDIFVCDRGAGTTARVSVASDGNAANSTTQAEVVIYVNAPGGIVRDFVVPDANPLADILV